MQNRVLESIELKQKNHYNYNSNLLPTVDFKNIDTCWRGKKGKTWHVITLTPPQIATISMVSHPTRDWISSIQKLLLIACKQTFRFICWRRLYWLVIGRSLKRIKDKLSFEPEVMFSWYLSQGKGPTLVQSFTLSNIKNSYQWLAGNVTWTKVHPFPWGRYKFINTL